MLIVFNAGSSSLKMKVFRFSDNSLELLKEQTISDIDNARGAGHQIAASQLLKELGQVEVRAIAHRIVMGGIGAQDGELASRLSLSRIKSYSKFAPLHNPPAIAVVVAAQKAFKSVKNHLYYDTTYYNDLPNLESTYPLDLKTCQRLGIRKYGFHGISHRYAFERSGLHKYSKVVSVHLGAGCSVTAIENCIPIATSMGMTPQGGVIMKSRSGDLDPGIVFYLLEKLGYKKAKLSIENHSGLRGLTGGSGEMLEVLALAGELVEDNSYRYSGVITSEKKSAAQLALNLYCQKVKDYVGSYAARMNGLDAIVFTGKIGAGSAVVRDRICYGLDYLSLKEVAVVEPNEELAIAEKYQESIINCQKKTK